MSTAKITVVLNTMGQIAGASRPTSTESSITSGMVADLGQTILELDVASHVVEMDGDKLLSQLAEHASVKAATAHFAAEPSLGEEITSGTL